jgi:trans-2,3-dihydro-3-hydroxyanthranilate isomerase
MPERDGTVRWVIEQGFEMGRPSLLHLEVDKRGGEITAVRVGGSSVGADERRVDGDPVGVPVTAARP